MASEISFKMSFEMSLIVIIQTFLWNVTYNYHSNWHLKCHYKCILKYFYRPQRSWGKVMFLQASVILLTGGSRHPPGTDTLPEQTPLPRADTPPRPDPPEQTPPLEQTPPGPDPPPPTSMLWDTTINARAVRILLECNLVWNVITNVSKYKLRRHLKCKGRPLTHCLRRPI